LLKGLLPSSFLDLLSVALLAVAQDDSSPEP
jgi:hypothetical protein